MSRKKFSVTGIVLVASMLVCLIIFLVVVPGGIGSSDKKHDLDDENSPGMKTVIEDGSPLLIFDKRSEVSQLMSAYEDDQVASVLVSHGGEGGVDEISTDDQENITAVYKSLKNVIVMDKTDKSVEDMTTVITFVMEDGSSCPFTFQDKNIYVKDGQNYKIKKASDLWKVITTLPEDQFL